MDRVPSSDRVSHQVSDGDEQLHWVVSDLGFVLWMLFQSLLHGLAAVLLEDGGVGLVVIALALFLPVVPVLE